MSIQKNINIMFLKLSYFISKAHHQPSNPTSNSDNRLNDSRMCHRLALFAAKVDADASKWEAKSGRIW